MWTRASLEQAARRLAAFCRAAARVQTRDLAIVFGRVAAVLFFLELGYLGVGNALLKTDLIQQAVASADGFHLDFDGAYTLWPGHARVRNLSLRVEDYNVQFEVALAEADVDISLSELFSKKFHITRLVSNGTRFRMRHKLIAIGDDAERVAAYPPIKGFADPPYYVGVRPPPIPDADYDLWSLRLENVQARVTELWVMEYRFRGQGLASGSFMVKPARWVQVEPARLELEEGTLALGVHRVAEHVNGRVTCDIPDMHVQETEGLQVLRDILAGVRLRLAGGQLDFLRAYLARFGSARYGGNAEWLVDVRVDRGVVKPESRVNLRAAPFEIRYESADISGDLMLSFARAPAPVFEQLVLALDAPQLTAARSANPAPSPRFDGVVGSVAFDGVDLKREISLAEARAVVEKASAPSLAWFSTTDVALQGAATASLRIDRAADGSAAGQARLDAVDARVVYGSFAAEGELRSQLAFTRGRDRSSPLDMQKLAVSVEHALLTSGDKRSQPFALALDGAGLRVQPTGKVGVSGALRVHVSSTAALLPLVVGAPVRNVTRAALDLKGLDAQAAIDFSRNNWKVRVVDARSGNLRLRGYLTQRTQQPRAAFLLSSGPLNVGVTLSDGNTDIAPFVADDWLAITWSRLSG